MKKKRIRANTKKQKGGWDYRAWVFLLNLQRNRARWVEGQIIRTSEEIPNKSRSGGGGVRAEMELIGLLEGLAYKGHETVQHERANHVIT